MSHRMISTILRHDSKWTSYEIALLRARDDVVLAWADVDRDDLVPAIARVRDDDPRIVSALARVAEADPAPSPAIPSRIQEAQSTQEATPGLV